MYTKLSSILNRNRHFAGITFIFLLFSLFTVSCAKDPTSRIKGNWKMEFTGSIQGSMPLTIDELPLESTGLFPITLGGKTINYDLNVTVDESGVLDISVLDQGIEAGYISGNLGETGSGAGDYFIIFEKDGSFFELNGQWSASKN